MKAARVLRIGTLVFVVALGAALGVALNARFQTWLVRRTLAAHPELHLSVARVDAGFRRIEVTGLKFERDGVRLEAPSVTATLPVLSFVWSRRVHLSQFTARGWTVEITEGATPARAASAADGMLGNPQPSGAPRPDSAAAASGAAPRAPEQSGFAGVLTPLRLPYDTTVDQVDVAGVVRMVPAQAAANVTITGGGMGAGRTARFDVAAKVSLETGRVDAVDITGVATATMDSARTFAAAGAKLAGTASGSQLGHPVALAADVQVRRADAGESYDVTVNTPERNVLTIAAKLPAARERLAGRWQIDVRDADVAPLVPRRALPGFAAVGEGSWDSDALFRDLRAAGTLDAQIDRLAVLSPELAGIGPVKINADIDVARHDDVIGVSKVKVTFAGERPVATVSALQPFAFNPRTGDVTAERTGEDLLDVTLEGVPLAWARPFIRELAVSGTDIRGEFVASPRAGGFTFHSKAPLSVAKVAVARAGKPLAQDVDLSLSLNGDYTPQGWQAEINGFGARGPEKFVLLTARAGQLSGREQPVKATGLLTLDLAQLGAQPALRERVSVQRGQASVEFAASVGAQQQLQATFAVKNLAAGAGPSNPSLPEIGGTVRADIDADGRVTFNAPITLDRGGRKSDLNVVGTISRDDRGAGFDAQLSSNALILDDAKVLGALVAPSPERSDNAVEAPFWKGLTGTVALQVKKLVYTGRFEMTNVTGKLHLAGGAITLEDVRAGVGEGGSARLAGALAYDEPGRYSAQTDVALTDFDPGPWFAAANPAQPPTIEGRFTIVTKLEARAGQFRDLPHAASGEFEVTSKGGVFRGLPVNVGNLVENSTKLPGWLASAGNAITSLAGRKDFDEITSRSQAANELAKMLSAIAYDQLAILVTRDQALNLQVKELTLISPELRITGSGRARPVNGRSMLNDVVELNLTVRARGRPAELMKYLGILDSATDDLGYAACTLPVRVEGSLVNLDSPQLSNRLVALAVEKTGLTEKAVDWINRLRGKGPN